MLIKQKNQGSYLKYSLDGNVLIFGENELSIDLAEREDDFPISLDISRDRDGKLVEGVGFRYIAEIMIPARSYEIQRGASDDFGFLRLKKVVVPFDPEQVTLTLWALEV